MPRSPTEHGWSRSILVMQIETRAYERPGQRGQQLSGAHCPPPQSDLARDVLERPVYFRFPRSRRKTRRSAISKRALTAAYHAVPARTRCRVRVRRAGNTGSKSAETSFSSISLFYHLKLRCYVVVELKATPFKPEYAGAAQLLSVRGGRAGESGRTTTRPLACCCARRITVWLPNTRCAGIAKPMGVAEYQLLRENYRPG